jgi:hypothetical protein
MTESMNSRNIVAAGLALTIAGLIAWVATTMIPPARKGAVEVTQLSLQDETPTQAVKNGKPVVLVTQLSQ